METKRWHVYLNVGRALRNSSKFAEIAWVPTKEEAQRLIESFCNLNFAGNWELAESDDHILQANPLDDDFYNLAHAHYENYEGQDTPKGQSIAELKRKIRSLKYDLENAEDELKELLS